MQKEKDEPKKLDLALSFSRMACQPDEEEEERETVSSPVPTGSPQQISAAQRPVYLADIRSLEEEENEDDAVPADFAGEDFEFAFVGREPETIPADQIFSNGQIRAVYLFQGGGGDGPDEENDDGSSSTGSGCAEKVVRLPLGKLFIEDRESCSSSESDDLEGLPAESYCVWIPRSAPPTPENRKKSSSTGSTKRWRLRDLVGRSQSDGKDKFVFLAAPAGRSRSSEKKSPEREKMSPEKEKKSPERSTDRNSVLPPAGEEVKKGRKGKDGVRISEMDMFTAHRVFYGKGGADGVRRRPLLPYRKEVVSFFGNVTGVGRG